MPRRPVDAMNKRPTYSRIRRSAGPAALAALRRAHAALDFDIVAVDGVERGADVAKDVGVG